MIRTAPSHLATFTSARRQLHARCRPGRAARAADLDRRQGRHGHQDVRLHSAACSPSVSSTRSTTSTAGPVACRVVRAHRAHGSARRAIDVQGRKLRVPRPGHLTNGDKYQKLNIEKTDDATLSIKVTNGWIAGMQHHFVSAVVPDPRRPYTYHLGVKGREYVLDALGPTCRRSRPARTATVKENLFVGPKLQKQLETLQPGARPRRRLRRPHADLAAAVLAARPRALDRQELGPRDHLRDVPAQAAVLSAVGEGRPLDGAHARARAAHEGAAGNLQGRSLEARPGDDGAVQARRR